LKLLLKPVLLLIVSSLLLSCQPSVDPTAPMDSPLSPLPTAEVPTEETSTEDETKAYGEDRLLLPMSASAGLEASETEHQFFRLIEGLDNELITMSEEEVEQQLNDPWATYVLKRGVFPTSLEEILSAIGAQGVFSIEDEPGPDFTSQSFVVGEGSQIVVDGDMNSKLDRDFRIIAVWEFIDGTNTFLTLPAEDRLGLHELMSWDGEKQAFNFYRRIDEPSRWVHPPCF